MQLIKLPFLLAMVLIISSCGDSQPGGEKPSEEQQTGNVSPADTLFLTAENGKAIGPNIKYMPEWKAFGWFTSSDSVQWTVDVKESGSYHVWLEWSVDDKESGKEFILSTGKDQLIGTVGKSGSWETFKTENVGTINLEKGQQTLTFKSNTQFSKDGALLDLRGLKLIKR